MNAYAFKAALYCEECAEGIKARLAGRLPAWQQDDSDHFPQGPYGEGGGEADSPQHCDACFVFLRNPLTPDGVEYVRDKVAEHMARPAAVRTMGSNAVAAEWSQFYGIGG